jgi:hypothetical protein
VESQKPWKREHKLALAAVMLSALVLLWNVGSTLVERPAEQLVLLVADELKNPRTDIALLGPKAQTIYPDSRGMLLVPRSWAGKNLPVYDRATWQEITTIRLQDLRDEPQRRTIPDD